MHPSYAKTDLSCRTTYEPCIRMNRRKPLWRVEDQEVRLSELKAGADAASKDNPLRQDVRSLGTILGKVLVDQAGEDLLALVEQLLLLLIENHTRTHATGHP